MTSWTETPELLAGNRSLRLVVAVEPGACRLRAPRTTRREDVSPVPAGRQGGGDLVVAAVPRALDPHPENWLG